MRRQYEIAETGTVLISPYAKYCKAGEKGKVFEQFLAAIFESRFSNMDTKVKKIEIPFIVGGLLQGLNHYNVEKQEGQTSDSDSDNEKRNSQTKKIKYRKPPLSIVLQSLVSSAQEAYSMGKQIGTDWFNANKKSILAAAIAQIDKKYSDPQMRDKIRIELYDTEGIEQYSKMMVRNYHAESPQLTITIRIQEWSSVWAGKEKQFTQHLAILMAHFERGRKHVQELIRKNEIIKLSEFGLTDKYQAMLFNNNIHLPSLASFTDEENQFLCEAQGLSYEEFQRAISNNSENNEKKDITTFIRITLAALEYFDKKHDKKFSKEEKILHTDSFLKVFRNELQYMLVEGCGLALVDGKMLYPQPKMMDAIQIHLSTIASVIYQVELDFGATYYERPVLHTQRAEEAVSKEETRLGRRGSDGGDHSSDGSGSSPKEHSFIHGSSSFISTSEDSSSASSSNGTEEDVQERDTDDLLSSINSMIHALISHALKSKSNSIDTLKVLYKFIDWYKLALTKVYCAKNISRFQDLEQSFWKSAGTVLEQTKKGCTQHSVLLTWESKLQSLALGIKSREFSVMDKDIPCVQEQVRTLINLLSDETVEPVLAVSKDSHDSLSDRILNVQADIDQLEESDSDKNVTTELLNTVTQGIERLASKSQSCKKWK
jgi:hypothetical protein